MNIEPPRVVFDCNIFVQMFLNPNGSAGACKELAEKGAVILFVSQTILAEVIDVLSRPRFKKLFPALTPERIEAFIEEIEAISVPITNVPEEFRYERDPEDEPYINLAVVTGAKYVVSLDNDLLDLMKAKYEASGEFQRRYPMLKVITPAALLAELRRQ
jgi:putative PIN family toxin of toxin-antitoxin system